MSLRIAIVEDNSTICEELTRLISRTEGMICCATCRNGNSALQRLPQARPDVIIMDVRLPNSSGVECVRALKPLLPATQIIMFTVSDDPAVIVQAIEAGAIGYLLKSSSSDDIIAAIRGAARREAPMTPGIARKLVEIMHREARVLGDTAQLTKREKEIAALLAQGLGDKQIADRLLISLTTVNTHLKNIYVKLGVHSRTEVAVKYTQLEAGARAS